jgi:hypothetical protein
MLAAEAHAYERDLHLILTSPTLDVRFTPKKLCAKSGHRSALTCCENPKIIPVTRKGGSVAIDASSYSAHEGSYG